MIASGRRLSLVYQSAKQDVVKNLEIALAVEELRGLLGRDFFSATLFTTEFDLHLLFNRRGQAHCRRSAPTKTEPARTEHNRSKQRVVDSSANFLAALEVTTADGHVRGSMAGKFKQINRFVEILRERLATSQLASSPTISAIDIGSGKGYLTFAMYDLLDRQLARQATVVGVEMRSELVDFCNRTAKQLKFEGLSFQAGQADQIPVESVDILLALHACDTATDDAIFRGIAGRAELILVAPCCQHELAPQLSERHSPVEGIMRFGLLKQRQADLVTDAVRGLLMEVCGYRVQAIEFISTEHTAKNLLLVGVRDPRINSTQAIQQYQTIKDLFGFQHHALESKLRLAGLL